jgi:hypothetical protein
MSVCAYADEKLYSLTHGHELDMQVKVLNFIVVVIVVIVIYFVINITT